MKNIFNFTNTSDYLPIFVAALLVDSFVILRVVLKQIQSKSLTSWYKKYGIFSVLADVLSLVIGVIITRFIYSFFNLKPHLSWFLLLAVVVQVSHDLLFTVLFNTIPRGKSEILDTFKDYGKEFGPIILLADALMMVATILIATWLTSQSVNTLLIIGIVTLYILPYLLYSI